jgi:hypothetical protein
MTDRDDGLRERIARLPRARPPERDLWAGVARGIAASRRRSRVRVVAVSASALALAAGAAVALGLRPAPIGTAPIGSGESPPIASAASASSAPLAGEVDYEGAERALASDLETRRASLPAAAATAVDANLRILDEAIASTRDALRAHPDDPDLRVELDRVWGDKIDLLRQATESPSEL